MKEGLEEWDGDRSKELRDAENCGVNSRLYERLQVMAESGVDMWRETRYFLEVIKLIVRFQLRQDVGPEE